MNKINTINGVLMASQDELNEHVENGTAHVTEEERIVWNTQASVNAKGIVIATQGDLDEHAGNKAIHLTEEERTAWNAKADTSDLVSKVDVETFNAHKGDDAVHITEKDRNSWNGKQDKLTDDEGNMTLAGGMTAAATINANGGVNIPLMPIMDTDCVNLAFVKAFNPLFISTCDYINVAITGDANRYKVYPDRVYCKDTWGIQKYTRCEITSLRTGENYEGSDCVFIPCDILAKNRAPAQKISISWGGTVNSGQSVQDWDVDASAPFSLTIELLFQDDAGESSTRSIQVRKRQMGFNQDTVVETDWQPVDAYPDNFANGGDSVLSIGLVYTQKSENWVEAEGCLYFLCYHIPRGRYYAFPLIRTHGKHNYSSRLSSPRITLTNEAYGTAKAYGNVHLDAPIIYYGPNNAFYQFITSIEYEF